MLNYKDCAEEKSARILSGNHSVDNKDFIHNIKSEYLIF